MTHTLRSLGAALCLFVALLATAAHAQRPQNSPARTANVKPLALEKLTQLTERLKKYVGDGQLPGAVTIVVRDGRVAHLQAVGFRDREASAPMQSDSIFRIASQTKALVSVGIMQLQEEGRLSIMDAVGRYLPEFAKTTVAVAKPDGKGYDVVPARRPITIRDLLTHTAGLGYGSGVAADEWKAAGIQGWYFADRDEPIAATVSRMSALPFAAHPGERFVYGYGTDVLGVVIEKISGKPLDVFLRERITGPLRMNDTHFYLPREKANRLAVVYSRSASGLERAPATGGMFSQGAYVDGPRKSLSGGAGLLSTASDYARFLQALLNGGELDGVRILGRKSVELMTSDHLRGFDYQPGVGFGLGFSVLKQLGPRGLPGSVGEWGWGGAYHSTYWVDPVERLVVMHLTQVLPAGDLEDYEVVRAMVYAALPNHFPAMQ